MLRLSISSWGLLAVALVLIPIEHVLATNPSRTSASSLKAPQLPVWLPSALDRTDDVCLPSAPLVRRVDHIYVTRKDREAAASFLKFLKDDLKLPLAWPLSDVPSGDAIVHQGAVYLGNINLEVLTPWIGTSGLSLAPGCRDLKQVAARLQQRQIPHSEPISFEGSLPLPSSWLTEAQLRFWLAYLSRQPEQRGKVMDLLGLKVPGNSELHAFFIDYIIDIEGLNRINRMELNRSGGGPLGLVRAKELLIEIGSELREAKVKFYGDLLNGATLTEELGPEIRFKSGSHDRFVGVVLEVHSLTKARRFLRNKGWLGRETEQFLEIRHPVLSSEPPFHSFDMFLVEARSEKERQ